VRDAIIAWRMKRGGADPGGFYWSLPVVAETWDGWLNDVNGFHVKPDDVFNALNSAHGGAIDEGSVGGGTGMVCYEFKGGTGTASGTGSSDLFIAFSTASREASNPDKLARSVGTLPNDRLDPIFEAVVQATEEAVVNALVDNQTMTGRDDHKVEALPHDRVRELLKKYNRAR